jgi:hypothetical protein
VLFRAFAATCAAYYVCWEWYDYNVLGRLASALDDDDEPLSDEELEELEPLFIPFPFTTRQIESLPYRGIDPEWQAFVKISKDQKIVRSLEYSLAVLCQKAVGAHPGITQKYGTQPKIVKYMVDVQYPTKPPPTFVRKGLLIDDAEISVSEQPVDSWTVFRLRRLLWPSTFTASFMSFTWALVKQNAEILARTLGYDTESRTPSSAQAAFEKIQQHLERSSVKPDSKVNESSSDKPPGLPGSLNTGSTVRNPLPSGPSPSTDSKQQSLKDQYAIKMAKEHSNAPGQAFKQKYAQLWRPLHDYPPRGSLSVSGVVELDTPRARITVEAFAWFDPKSQKFDSKSLILRWRSIRPKAQRPLRP